MKSIHRKIWNLALPYQDKRDDKGHARTVVSFAIKLLKTEKADPDVVIPAAILHDIGWSRLSKKERFSIFKPEPAETGKTFSGDIEIRKKHQDEGVKIARRILSKTKYNKTLVSEILEIISEHDTRIGFISKNEGVMRDADKLWRFSRTGFLADSRRRNMPHLENLRRLKQKTRMHGFFYSKTAKKIAAEELKKRKKEFKL